jgi:hypothetical protein
LRNALTEADKYFDSWWKYIITDCYCHEYMAGQGLASCLHGHLTVEQEEIHRVFN